MDVSNSQLTPTVACYLLQNDKVLLGLRKKVSLGLGKNLLSGIGGKVGDKPEWADETDEEALRREADEEIGVQLGSFHHVGEVTFIFPAKPKWDQKVQLYIGHSWQGTPRETAVIKPKWYDVDHLPFDQMWDDARYYLPLILHGEQIQATFTYGSDNTTVIQQKVTRVRL